MYYNKRAIDAHPRGCASCPKIRKFIRYIILALCPRIRRMANTSRRILSFGFKSWFNQLAVTDLAHKKQFEKIRTHVVGWATLFLSISWYKAIFCNVLENISSPTECVWIVNKKQVTLCISIRLYQWFFSSFSPKTWILFFTKLYYEFDWHMYLLNLLKYCLVWKTLFTTCTNLIVSEEI